MKSLPVQIQENLIQLIDPVSDLLNVNFLLAVSGGKDSMVMAHAFFSLGLNFGIAHFNFKLRGEASELDEELIRGFCRENDLEFHSLEADTEYIAKEKKLSIQEAARELRYDFFDSLINSENYDYICTAHHGNDQLESFFINLFRGSGLKGLKGIPARRGQIIRPMIWVPQKILHQYADHHNIEYREDESNKSDKYLRNRIRHNIIKPITHFNAGYLKKSLDSIQLLNESQMFMDDQLKHFNKTCVKSYSDKVQMIANLEGIFNHDSNSFLLKLHLLDQGLYPDSIQDLFLSEGKWITGKRYEGDNIDGWYDRNKLWLVRNSFFTGWHSNDKIELSEGADVLLPGGDQVGLWTPSSSSRGLDTYIIKVKTDEVSLPLYMRHWKAGDFIESGSPPYFRKSLKKLYNEYKVPRPFKDRIYLIVDSADRIISVPGLVNSQKYTTEGKADMMISYKSNIQFLFTKEQD